MVPIISGLVCESGASLANHFGDSFRLSQKVARVRSLMAELDDSNPSVSKGSRHP